MLDASIKRAIKVMPSESVTLSGKLGEIKSKDLFISSELDKPLEIKPGKFTLKGKVNYRLEVIKAEKEYKISFRNNPDVAGNFRGYLKLSTNYRENNEIIIRINSVFN